MAKATPEELAMHQSAADELEALTQSQENLTVDNTAGGDIDKDTVAPKRKRGRPSNAEKALGDALEKENPGNAAAGESVGAKPGRKPKGKSVPNGEALGKQLVGIHALAAMMLQIPEVQIADHEGAMLGNAVVAVCEEYGLAIGGKTGAAIQLLAAAAMIYAPRALIIKSRIAQARAAQQAQPEAPQFGASLHVVTPGQN